MYGLKRRTVASFEEKVRNIRARYDRIDVFYSGVMLGEHKSRGEDLSSVASQAFDYVQSLAREGRADEAPQFIVVSDFETIAVYDLESKAPGEPIAAFKTAKTSSERRPYIPIGFLQPNIVTTTEIQMIPGATPYHFGILTSEMHMAWVRQVCGRLESRYRYSNKLVYNNFPWPQDVSERQRGVVEACAEEVLAVRASFKGQTLADLYDPLAMPKALREAHKDLDRAVDKCYRSAPFTGERQRVEYLFELYQKLTTPLTAETAGKKGAGAKRARPGAEGTGGKKSGRKERDEP